IAPDGLFALYALGLNPVLRGQLADADKFDAWVAGFAKAYGHSLAEARIDDTSYRHLTLGKSSLQLVIASLDKQFVIAIV
uniref:hypothetical protein n=1 Tax=Acinetobacter baumannii TaxID=470 RepID=UPI001C08FFBD